MSDTTGTAKVTDLPLRCYLHPTTETGVVGILMRRDLFIVICEVCLEKLMSKLKDRG